MHIIQIIEMLKVLIMHTVKIILYLFQKFLFDNQIPSIKTLVVLKILTDGYSIIGWINKWIFK